jgi:hypothetical protein
MDVSRSCDKNHIGTFYFFCSWRNITEVLRAYSRRGLLRATAEKSNGGLGARVFDPSRSEASLRNRVSFRCYSSRCTVSMEKAGRQTAIYSAPPSWGVE